MELQPNCQQVYLVPINHCSFIIQTKLMPWNTYFSMGELLGLMLECYYDDLPLADEISDRVIAQSGLSDDRAIAIQEMERLFALGWTIANDCNDVYEHLLGPLEAIPKNWLKQLGYFLSNVSVNTWALQLTFTRQELL